MMVILLTVTKRVNNNSKDNNNSYDNSDGDGDNDNNNDWFIQLNVDITNQSSSYCICHLLRGPSKAFV